MKILLNASSVSYGGGLTEILNFLQGLTNIKLEHQLLLVCPKQNDYVLFEKYFDVIYVPEDALKWRKRFFLDYKWFKSVIRKHHIDIVFSLGNLPLPVETKQALFFDNPFITVSNLKSLHFNFRDRFIHYLRKKFFFNRLKYVDLIFVQTKIQQKLLSNLVKNIPMEMMENAPSIIFQKSIQKHFSFDKDKIKLLVFTRYYPHKNLEVLLKVSEIIKANKKPYQIILTIDNEQHANVWKMLKKINTEKNQDVIINIGKINRNHIKSLYEQVDALLLPTLMESFSTTYADSMGFGVTVFTSDLDFAKEVCGDAAFYFNPYNENSIFEVIDSAFSNPEIINKKIKIGKEIVNSRRSWEQIAKDVLLILEKL